MGLFDDEFNPAAPPEGRIEAVAKVTGAGKYAAEYDIPGLAHGVIVESAIPAGRIRSFNLDDARRADGVLYILTHENSPAIPGYADEEKLKQNRFQLKFFGTDQIYFKGQPIALVVAGTLEEAVYAASLVTANYEEAPFNIDFEKSYTTAQPKRGKDRGNPDIDTAGSFVVDEVYTQLAEIHHPMEMHATIAQWQPDGKLKLWDKTQGVNNVQKAMGMLLGMPPDNIEVMAEFMGGGFGSGLRVWVNTLGAAIAARQLNRPVKVMLTRAQMSRHTGYRPQARQHIKIAADKNGKLSTIIHEGWTNISMYDEFNEDVTRMTRMLYAVDNLRTEASFVRLNLSTPTSMRAPGEATGAIGMECGMDELATKLNLDPVALRLKNISFDKHPDTGKTWSTHFLREAIEKGAETIGWSERRSTPKSISNGDLLTGYGFAVGMWNSSRREASASITMDENGSITVATAMTDIGTGTGTGLQNMAHEHLGIDKDRIKVALGNSNLPPAPMQGGSFGLSSIAGAMGAASDAFKEKLIELAIKTKPTFGNLHIKDLKFEDKGIRIGGKAIAYEEIIKQNGGRPVEVEGTGKTGAERDNYAFHSSSAHFCKLSVNRRTGKVKIDRYVCVCDGGKIINPKPAANQVSGSVTGGIGMALMEHMSLDKKLGSQIADDLAGYHFPVNADVPQIEVAFINKPDMLSNPSGSKGLGEVGIVGVAAAVANAIYNATGKRLRHFPIKAEDLVG